MAFPTARIAGIAYLITFAGGGASMALAGNARQAANLIGTAAYVVVTALLYEMFKPVDRRISLLAACFSLVGCALGANQATDTGLVFFAFYCSLIGWLVLRSGVRPIGILMMAAGCGWLTFLWPPLAKALAPWNMLPGMAGELAFTVWLFTKGENS